jgi:GrpB-like predicted nucleotidyltransferase (UPF0157 family)
VENAAKQFDGRESKTWTLYSLLACVVFRFTSSQPLYCFRNNVCLFGNMKVSVVEYCPQWREMFEEEKQLLQTVLCEVSAKVEHIGSTAVIGLAAKPIIDIMIGLSNFSVADELVPRIEALSYEYFKKYEDEMPYRRYLAKNLNEIRTHQIHMVEIGSEFWRRHLLFRNYLQQNPEMANEYAALKKQLAEHDWADVNEYADAKTEFIMGIENKAKEQITA